MKGYVGDAQHSQRSRPFQEFREACLYLASTSQEPTLTAHQLPEAAVGTHVDDELAHLIKLHSWSVNPQLLKRGVAPQGIAEQRGVSLQHFGVDDDRNNTAMVCKQAVDQRICVLQLVRASFLRKSEKVLGHEGQPTRPHFPKLSHGGPQELVPESKMLEYPAHPCTSIVSTNSWERDHLPHCSSPDCLKGECQVSSF
ncbi:hypothetical protein MRX96_042672 [Rhipicephalus microplus]